MKLFEIKAPDGRILRQRHESLVTLQAQLQPGYDVVGEVLGASHDDLGGLVQPIGGPSLMQVLLDAHGDELLAWLDERRGKKVKA